MPYLLALTLLVSPLYVWRFSLAGLPLNFLLVWVVAIWIIFAVWLATTGQVGQFLDHCRGLDRKLLLLIVLFVLAGCISLVTGGITQAKLGQWLVWFIQPVSVFFIAHFASKNNPRIKTAIQQAAYLFVAVAGLVALAQYFTLVTLPPAYWGNSEEPKRAIGLFAHPDMFGLFLAPLMAWLVPDVLRRLDGWREKVNWIAIAAWLAGGAGLLLSLSRGAWFGFVLAAAVGIIAYGRKKYWTIGLAAAACAIAIVAVVPNLRYRLILPFKGEKSSLARLSLWQTGEKMIKDSPILGKGLDGFNLNWYKYNKDPNLNHYNFPHNLILNFWVDTGLLGAASFIALLLYGWWYGFRYRTNAYALGLALFLLALAVHGLLDTPYLKNDLALAFWLIWGISLV